MSLLDPIKGFIRSKKQERLARDLSFAALDGFDVAHAHAPQLNGEPLYELALSTKFGVDPTFAHEIVRHARESYTEWPVARNLTFSDVVHYYVVDFYLKTCKSRPIHWVEGDIGHVVRSVIPHHI